MKPPARTFVAVIFLALTLGTSSADAAWKRVPTVRHLAAATIQFWSFEGSTSGWDARNATLSLASDGIDGKNAALVTARHKAADFSLYPTRMLTSATMARTVYSVTASLRSSRSRSLCLRLREWSGNSVIGSAQGCVLTGAAWQAVPAVAYTARGNGQLDAYVYGTDVAADEAFEVDAISLSSQDVAPAPAPSLLSPPTALVANNVSTTGLSLSWTPSADQRIVSYEVSQNGSILGRTGSSSFAISSLLCSTQYGFGVRGLDAGGNPSAGAFISVTTAACPSAGTPVSPTWLGNYETGDFAQWLQVPLEGPSTQAVEQSLVHEGRYAARFEIGSTSSAGRTEVQDDVAKYGGEEWYRWSEYVPASTAFAPHSSFNHLVQFHPWTDPCYGSSLAVDGLASPAHLILRMRGGTPTDLSAGCAFPSDRTFDLGEVQRDKWLDFVFHVRWSGDPGVGFVELWMNGAQVVPFTQLATADTGRDLHVRQGLYRFQCDCSTVVYGDGFSKFDQRPSF